MKTPTLLPLAYIDSERANALKIHDGRKLLRVQACAADQRPINLDLRHQSLDIVGFDAAPIKDAQAAARSTVNILGSHTAQKSVRICGNFRGCGAPGPDRPDRLVSDDNT